MVFGHSYRAESRKKQVADGIEERVRGNEKHRTEKRKRATFIFSLVILSVLCE